MPDQNQDHDQQESGAKTYLVPQENIGKLEQKLQKMQKRADKLGTPPITYSVDRDHPVFKPYPHEPHRKYICFPVTVKGSEPVIEGWKLLASIKHMYDDKDKPSNVVRTFGSADRILPEKFWTMDPKCEHCNLNRARKHTVILEDDEGKFKQIGKGCLKDFIGHGNPDAVVSYATSLQDLLDKLGDEESEWIEPPLFGSASWLGTEKYLSFVAMAIRKDGWVSRQVAYDSSKESTADAAAYAMEQSWKTDEPAYIPNAKDQQMAKDVVQYFADLDTTDTFRRNLKVLVSKEAFPRKEMGMVAYAVQDYIKQQYKQQVARTPSKHIGNVGDRVKDLKLTVDRVNEFEGQYGVTSFVRCFDENGNVVKLKMSGVVDMDRGDKLTVEATVLSHDVWNGVNETLLGNRPKVVVVGFIGRPNRLATVSVVLEKQTDIRSLGTGEMLGNRTFIGRTADNLNVILTYYANPNMPDLQVGKSYKVRGSVDQHWTDIGGILGKENAKYTIIGTSPDAPTQLKKPVVPVEPEEPEAEDTEDDNPLFPAVKEVLAFLESGELDRYVTTSEVEVTAEADDMMLPTADAVLAFLGANRLADFLPFPPIDDSLLKFVDDIDTYDQSIVLLGLTFLAAQNCVSTIPYFDDKNLKRFLVERDKILPVIAVAYANLSNGDRANDMAGLDMPYPHVSLAAQQNMLQSIADAFGNTPSAKWGKDAGQATYFETVALAHVLSKSVVADSMKALGPDEVTYNTVSSTYINALKNAQKSPILSATAKRIFKTIISLGASDQNRVEPPDIWFQMSSSQKDKVRVKMQSMVDARTRLNKLPYAEWLSAENERAQLTQDITNVSKGMGVSVPIILNSGEESIDAVLKREKQVGIDGSTDYAVMRINKVLDRFAEKGKKGSTPRIRQHIRTIKTQLSKARSFNTIQRIIGNATQRKILHESTEQKIGGILADASKTLVLEKGIDPQPMTWEPIAPDAFQQKHDTGEILFTDDFTDEDKQNVLGRVSRAITDLEQFFGAGFCGKHAAKLRFEFVGSNQESCMTKASYGWEHAGMLADSPRVKFGKEFDGVLAHELAHYLDDAVGHIVKDTGSWVSKGSSILGYAGQPLTEFVEHHTSGIDWGESGLYSNNWSCPQKVFPDLVELGQAVVATEDYKRWEDKLDDFGWWSFVLEDALRLHGITENSENFLKMRWPKKKSDVPDDVWATARKLQKQNNIQLPNITYWHSGPEVWARMVEQYVYTKMAYMGMSNPWLTRLNYANDDYMDQHVFEDRIVPIMDRLFARMKQSVIMAMFAQVLDYDDARYAAMPNTTKPKYLFHVSGWQMLRHKAVGDTIVLKPGKQGAEGKGVYFSEGVPRPTAAEGAKDLQKTIVVIPMPFDIKHWWRSKKSVTKKFGRPRTWHTKGKPLVCNVLKRKVRGDDIWLYCSTPGPGIADGSSTTMTSATGQYMAGKFGTTPRSNKGVLAVQQQEKDFETRAKFDELMRRLQHTVKVKCTPGIADLCTKSDGLWCLKDQIGRKMYKDAEYKEFITKYAQKDPREAFAEAFKLYVDQGARALGPWTRDFFERITRSGRRTAAVDMDDSLPTEDDVKRFLGSNDLQRYVPQELPVRHGVEIADKTITKRKTPGGGVKSWKSKYHDPELVKRVDAALAILPPYAVVGLRNVTVVPPEKGSLYFDTPGTVGQYIENLSTVYLSAQQGFEAIEGVLLHELGHHVFRKSLGNEEREALRTGIQEMDPARQTGYRPHQYAEEEFADGFGLIYNVLLGGLPLKTAQNMYPLVYDLLQSKDPRLPESKPRSASTMTIIAEDRLLPTEDAVKHFLGNEKLENYVDLISEEYELLTKEYELQYPSMYLGVVSVGMAMILAQNVIVSNPFFTEKRIRDYLTERKKFYPALRRAATLLADRIERGDMGDAMLDAVKPLRSISALSSNDVRTAMPYVAKAFNSLSKLKITDMVGMHEADRYAVMRLIRDARILTKEAFSNDWAPNAERYEEVLKDAIASTYTPKKVKTLFRKALKVGMGDAFVQLGRSDADPGAWFSMSKEEQDSLRDEYNRIGAEIGALTSSKDWTPDKSTELRQLIRAQADVVARAGVPTTIMMREGKSLDEILKEQRGKDYDGPTEYAFNKLSDVLKQHTADKFIPKATAKTIISKLRKARTFDAMQLVISDAIERKMLASWIMDEVKKVLVDISKNKAVREGIPLQPLNIKPISPEDFQKKHKTGPVWFSDEFTDNEQKETLGRVSRAISDMEVVFGKGFCGAHASPLRFNFYDKKSGPGRASYFADTDRYGSFAPTVKFGKDYDGVLGHELSHYFDDVIQYKIREKEEGKILWPGGSLFGNTGVKMDYWLKTYPDRMPGFPEIGELMRTITSTEDYKRWLDLIPPVDAALDDAYLNVTGDLPPLKNPPRYISDVPPEVWDETVKTFLKWNDGDKRKLSYWQSPIEIWARMVEQYTYNKLIDLGISNPWLTFVSYDTDDMAQYMDDETFTTKVQPILDRLFARLKSEGVVAMLTAKADNGEKTAYTTHTAAMDNIPDEADVLRFLRSGALHKYIPATKLDPSKYTSKAKDIENLYAELGDDIDVASELLESRGYNLDSKPGKKAARRLTQRTWANLMNVCYDLSKLLVDNKAIPNGEEKQFELAVRFALTARKPPINIFTWYKKARPRIDTLVKAATWPDKQMGKDMFALGTFTVHNLVGAKGEELERIKKLLTKTISLVEKVPDLKTILYGDVFIAGQMLRAKMLAWYNVSADNVSIRPYVKGEKGMEHNLLHEIAHRYYGRFMPQKRKAAWARHHFDVSWSDRGPVIMPKVGDMLPKYVTITGLKGRPTVKSIQLNNRYYFGNGIYLNYDTVYKLVQKHSRLEAFPTIYSATNEEEHFCEAMAKYLLGTLSKEHVDALEAVMEIGKGKEKKANVLTLTMSKRVDPLDPRVAKVRQMLSF